MALDASEVAVGGDGNVWRAPVGTAFPTNISTAVNEILWTELGYLTEEGVRFNFGRETNEIGAWQSFDPVRVVVTEVPKEISHDLRQLNQNTWATAMGGGTWAGSAPNYEYTPPLPSFIDEFSEIVEFRDGDEKYRFCFHRVIVSSPLEFNTVRDDALTLPVTIQVLAPPSGITRAWFWQTTDANLGDATQAGS